MYASTLLKFSHSGKSQSLLEKKQTERTAIMNINLYRAMIHFTKKKSRYLPLQISNEKMINPHILILSCLTKHRLNQSPSHHRYSYR